LNRCDCDSDDVIVFEAERRGSFPHRHRRRRHDETTHFDFGFDFGSGFIELANAIELGGRLFELTDLIEVERTRSSMSGDSDDRRRCGSS
jgi:hypothetical protein